MAQVDQLDQADKNWESPETKANKLLAKIESERFQTLDDPGIHGIKERLKQLGFIKFTAGECCSGHPQDGEDMAKHNMFLPPEEQTGLAWGYLGFNLRRDDPRSKSFHDQFRKLRAISFGFEVSHNSQGIRSEIAETEEKRGRNIDGYKSVRNVDGPPASFQWLAEKDQQDPEWLHVPYEFKMKAWGKPEEQTAQNSAEALKRFWTEVSGLINKYEEFPVKEKLEPWYFAVRSAYGKMEITHNAFSEYDLEVEKRHKNQPK